MQGLTGSGKTAHRGTQRPAKERTDDPAQVMFSRWADVYHANIQSVHKLIMGCQADQKALQDAQVRVSEVAWSPSPWFIDGVKSTYQELILNRANR
jgi:hypothetical protein